MYIYICPVIAYVYIDIDKYVFMYVQLFKSQYVYVCLRARVWVLFVVVCLLSARTRFESVSIS